MAAAGYSVRETDPFDDRPALALPSRETSPYVGRMRLLWHKMRGPVIERFPKAPMARHTMDGQGAAHTSRQADARHGAGSVRDRAAGPRGRVPRVYAVQLADAIWVIHAFQKKATQGMKTPQREVDLVKDRLKRLKEMLR
jgi:hypothetical protein